MNPGGLSRARGPLGPAVAGTWYPADPAQLAAEVDRCLGAASDSAAATRGDIVALIAPHAGFVYSGPVAGRAFLRVRGARYERVVLLGPSHYFRFAGGAVPRSAAYRTPLGEVAIDAGALGRLAGAPGLQVDDEPFRREHSLEAEIPFLQRTLAPGFRLLPVLIGAGTTGEAAESVAKALAPFLGPASLVVVSSDFTHYGPRFDYVPFTDDVPAGIDRLDRGAIERILAWDRVGFEGHIARTGATICGRDAVGILLRLLPAGCAGELAGYDTSGRITGDWLHSVSYASLVFRRPAA